MEELCRLCAVLKHPEEFKCKIDDLNFDIERKLVTCCNWNSYRSHDSLPKNVCIACFLQLEQCWYFRQTVSRAQQKLTGLAEVNIEPSSSHAFQTSGAECCVQEMLQVKTECTLDDEIEVNHIEVSEWKVENDYENSMSDSNNDIGGVGSCDDESRLYDEENILVESPMVELNTRKTVSKSKTAKEKIKRKITVSNHKQKQIKNNASQILEQNLSDWSIVMHRCYKCNENFKADADLWLHFTTKHQNEKFKYICPVCPDKNMLFLSGRYYREHIAKSHYPHLTHCCHKCQKFIYDYKKMRQHLKSHPKDSTASICSLCGKGFSYYKNLHFHMLSHLPDALQPQHECYLCKKMLKSHQSMKKHMKYHTGITKSAVCDQCGKVYVTTSKLKEHMTKHSDERPFSCESCPKTFKTSAILRRHMRIHQNFQQYVCDFCGHSTSDKQRLKQHIIRYHTNNDSPHPCDICGKPFYKIQTLNTHKKNIHFNTNLFPCGLCDHRAVNARALKRHHKHVHLNHRPHTCNFCEYSTYSKYNLQLHTSRRHGVRCSRVDETSQEQEPNELKFNLKALK